MADARDTHLRRIRLSQPQREALERCACGVSLRFEDATIVAALLNAGYVRRNIVGVITVTDAGIEYLAVTSALGAAGSA